MFLARLPQTADAAEMLDSTHLVGSPRAIEVDMPRMWEDIYTQGNATPMSRRGDLIVCMSCNSGTVSFENSFS